MQNRQGLLGAPARGDEPRGTKSAAEVARDMISWNDPASPESQPETALQDDSATKPSASNKPSSGRPNSKAVISKVSSGIKSGQRLTIRVVRLAAVVSLVAFAGIVWTAYSLRQRNAELEQMNRDHNSAGVERSERNLKLAAENDGLRKANDGLTEKNRDLATVLQQANDEANELRKQVERLREGGVKQEGGHVAPLHQGGNGRQFCCNPVP